MEGNDMTTRTTSDIYDKTTQYELYIKQLEAEAAVLREALEAILQQPGLYVHIDRRLKEQARAALSADAGREMLERIQAAEKILGRIRKKVGAHLHDTGHGWDDWLAIRDWLAEGS
jgi:uncharacterized membrane-anchored protein YjiN (DUF445 family)